MSKYTKDYAKKYNPKYKENIIKNVYTELGGFGSNANTLKDARLYDKDISLNDVVKWKADNIQRSIQLKGMNSFIASKPKQEYQMDLMFLPDLNREDNDDTYPGALLSVDIFTKYCSVIPIKSKHTETILAAIKETMDKMHGKPETIYSDREGGLASAVIQQYFKDEGIRSIFTFNHAAYAERTIRTIKHMLILRHEETKQKWYELLEPVLKTYNSKNASSITKMTPDDATEEKNHLDVKLNLEMHRRHSRKYPPIAAGENVRLYRKKQAFDKEDVSQWSNTVHKVEEITHSHGQDFYKVSGRKFPLVRADVLKLNPEDILVEKPYRERQHREKKPDEEDEEPKPEEQHPEPPQPEPQPKPPAQPSTMGSMIKGYVKKTPEEKAATAAQVKARREEMKQIMARRAAGLI